MLAPVKLGLTALAAALLLATAVSASSARNLSFSNQNIRVTWATLEFVGSSSTFRCPITLEGSFHSRTIPKVARVLIGAITKFDFGTCASGAGIRKVLPWHFTYESFAGTLPNITAINLLISRFLFLLTRFNVVCSLGAETDNITLSAARGAGGEVTSLAPVEGRNIAHLVRPAEEGFGCSEVKLIGSGSVSLLNSTTRITVTLI
jgi:hypothetical protein